jgi:hypothetical protein
VGGVSPELLASPTPVFTTELATVIARLDQLQSSLDAIRKDLDQEKF